MQVGKVYAKISIGVLGFIVWSYIMKAPPYCEIVVNNFAVCWDSSMLVGTLYSKNPIPLKRLINLSSLAQSAGNCVQNVYKRYSTRTSETIRERSFNFDNFNFIYKKTYNKGPIDRDWLIWFIGFMEGDGAILTYNNQQQFVISQKELLILQDIKKVQGFGTVRHFPATKNVNAISRFIISDKVNIFILAHLFNGNLVLFHRQNQLISWIKVQNSYKNNVNMSPLINLSLTYNCILPTLQDPWLSGFTDAEGCFNINITSRKDTITGFRVTPRFQLDQKNAMVILQHIRDIFGFGRVYLRSGTKEVYRYSVNSFKGLNPITGYFNSYPLKTKKKDSFIKWNKVYQMLLNKEHQREDGFEKIRVITKTINICNSLTIKTGSSLKKFKD